MLLRLVPAGLVLIACGAAFGQAPASDAAAARFEIADVHVTPKALANTFMEANPPRNGRYEFHSASMIDLIQLGYGFEDNKILGGPSWLEMDRFEVIAKMPAGTSSSVTPGATLPDAVRAMMQSLLAERFKLTIRQETRSLPGFALTADKKVLMKEGDGTGDTGCRYIAPTEPGDATVRFICRNMSMEALAAFWSQVNGPASAAVIDKTDLKGVWNFELKWTNGAGSENGPAAAIGKQLGLKLEPQAVPTPVLVVDSVNETPTDNVPGTAEALPIPPQPMAFDVATLKFTDPDFPGYSSSLNPQPGGLWAGRGMPLSSLLVRAFSPSYAQRNEDLVVGMPGWARTTRYDLTGRSPAGASASARAGPMVRSLLEERLKLKWHTEERAVAVYVLVAGKPKMKKADPASRTHCQQVAPPAGSPPGSVSLNCQNTSMELFGETIRRALQGPGSPVIDSTGLEGGWDFTLTFVFGRPVAVGADAGAPGVVPAAADPNGGLTIEEAIEKQLGLKLEIQKRPAMVTVIDHVEQTPADN